MNSKCGVQNKRKCGSHESCVCIVGFPACGCQKKSVVYEMECRSVGHTSNVTGVGGGEGVCVCGCVGGVGVGGRGCVRIKNLNRRPKRLVDQCLSSRSVHLDTPYTCAAIKQRQHACPPTNLPFCVQ